MKATSSSTACDEQLLDALASDGFDPPRVTPLHELYASYVAWSRQHNCPIHSIQLFAMRLARSFMPVRLPNGQLGFVGIALKSGPREWGGLP